MELKIEGSHEDLKNFQLFLYERDKHIEIDEEYKQVEGVHKEPILIAIIIALAPTVQSLFKEYMKYKTEKLKESNKASKIMEDIKEERLKLSTRKDKNWVKTSPEDIDKLETE